MNQNLLQDLQEGATRVGKMTAENPTLADLTMKLTAGQGVITI
jgi:hypothetical protein